MASKLAKIKEIILELLSDENEYTTDDIKKQILNCGFELDSKSSAIRTAIYQLRSSGIDIYSRDRGIYQLRKKRGEENKPVLKGFVTIFPNQKSSPKCLMEQDEESGVWIGEIIKNSKTTNTK